MVTARGRAADSRGDALVLSEPAYHHGWLAKRPFHEAMCRRARRARHTWQVFGLTGAHRKVHLLAVASQSDADQCV